MKIFPLLSPLVLLVFFCACKEGSDLKPRNGNLSFSFAQKDRSSGGRTETDLTPVAILLSISDDADNLLISDQKFPLIGIGNGFILANPIELSIGQKKLKKFIVLNSSNQGIYAAPVRGSQLASLVSNPLDISFDISPDMTTDVDVEVLPVFGSDDPESFGLATFSFHIVNRLPRLQKISYFDPSGLFSLETLDYSGDVEIPRTTTLYDCTDSAMLNRTMNTHWESDIDPISGKVLSLKNFSASNELQNTVNWLYNTDGSLRTMVSIANVATGAGGSREDFYYKSNGQFDYSIWRRTALDIQNFTGYVRQYTYGSDGNISKIETRYCTVFNGNLTIREQYMTEEYVYDNHPTKAAIYNDPYWWAPFFSPTPRRNNVTWSRFTSYTLVGSADHIEAQVSDIVEITRAYQYNELGLPSQETISVPGYNGFNNEVDGMVKRYTYGN